MTAQAWRDHIATHPVPDRISGPGLEPHPDPSRVPQTPQALRWALGHGEIEACVSAMNQGLQLASEEIHASLAPVVWRRHALGLWQAFVRQANPAGALSAAWFQNVAEDQYFHPWLAALESGRWDLLDVAWAARADDAAWVTGLPGLLQAHWWENDARTHEGVRWWRAQGLPWLQPAVPKASPVDWCSAVGHAPDLLADYLRDHPYRPRLDRAHLLETVQADAVGALDAYLQHGLPQATVLQLVLLTLQHDAERCFERVWTHPPTRWAWLKQLRQARPRGAFAQWMGQTTGTAVDLRLMRRLIESGAPMEAAHLGLDRPLLAQWFDHWVAETGVPPVEERVAFVQWAWSAHPQWFTAVVRRRWRKVPGPVGALGRALESEQALKQTPLPVAAASARHRL